MAQFIVFCLLLFAVLPSSAVGLGYPAASDDCPLWFTSDDNGSCECGSNLGGIVKCNNVSKETYLLGCFCMSYDSTGLVVGACPYHCYHNGRVDLHYPLPKHITDLEDFLCGPLNRKGRMCGQCKDNFTTSTYSYDLRCVKCSGGLIIICCIQSNNKLKVVIHLYLCGHNSRDIITTLRK